MRPRRVERYFPDRIGVMTTACSTTLAVGRVRGLAGSWSVPFGLLAALTAVLFASGLYVARERCTEDGPASPEKAQS